MWIRSQDKRKLVKCKELGVRSLNNHLTEELAKQINAPKGWGVLVKYDVLGFYSTKEKALKVLDMIEEFINKIEEFKAQGEFEEKIIDNAISTTRLLRFVFQMPQDEEINVNETKKD